MDLMKLRIEVTDLPIRSQLIALAEFVQITGSTAERVRELVDMAWLTPTTTAKSEMIFRHTDAYRLRKLERLCSDFDLHIVAGSIIVDLLERIDNLERRVRELQGE